MIALEELNQTDEESLFLLLKSFDYDLAEESFHYFVQAAWTVIVPGDKFVDNWHIKVICDHLEAVSRGEIRRLIINVPPRSSKSTIVSVMWPVWNWIKNPERRFLTGSHGMALSTRDALLSRRLIESDWFQEGWGDKFEFSSDQNQKTRYENDKMGYRLAFSMSSGVLGEGGDIIIIDDPHDIESAMFSDVERKKAIDTYDQSLTTRLNDPNKSAIVVIMQRLHEEDLTGHLLEEGGWEHLCFPNRFEPERRCKTCLGVQDYREKDGELFWPARFSFAWTEKQEKTLGRYGASGQLQQRPSPKEGGMFNVIDFQLKNEFPRQKIIKTIRYWDKAGTKDAGCFTSGTLMHKLNNGFFVVEDIERGQWSSFEREERIKQCAQRDIAQHPNIEVWMEQEPGSGGKESAESTVKNLAGFIVRYETVTGSKEARAYPYAVQVEAQNVIVLIRSWTKEFLHEHEHFPFGKYKDQVDSTSGAFNKLNRKSQSGTW